MFYSDKPIVLNTEDKLNRSGFAKLLAQTLVKLNSKDTFSVGLYGKWGSGKTSLVNMMLNEIETQQKNIHEENQLIVVRFEPWNFSDTNQLLSQFFIRLSNELRSKKDQKLLKIGEAIETYSEAFELTKAIPYVGGVLSLFGKKGATAIGKRIKKGLDEKDILKQKEYVINLLRNQARKILIIIDDIDRLNNEQIRQVFQLITSVAKFPNTIYFLVFDKDIVVKALKKVQEGNGGDYLEKVIQVPIQVPNAQRDNLRKVLVNRLKKILDEHKDIIFHQSHWERLIDPCIDPFIQSIRDVNRLCNLVDFKLTNLASEVNFTDMVAISALEIFLPQIYEWVKNNKSILTGELVFYIGQKKSQKDYYDLYYTQIHTLLSSGDKKDTYDTEKVMILLAYLFPHFGHTIGKIYAVHDNNMFRRNNQIAHQDKFDRYFDFDLDNIGLKKSEIIQALYFLSCKEFRMYLLDCDKKGTSYEFLEEIRAMIPKLLPERTKIILSALLDTSAELHEVSNKNILSINTRYYADCLVIELLNVISASERMTFLFDFVQTANLFSLSSIASVINKIELGYGRLAAEGEEHDYKKVISLEELLQLESVFTQKVKDMLREHNLFDFVDWKRICYLLEYFDAEFIKKYFVEVFVDEKNIVKYLDTSVTMWTGSSIEYETKDDYKKYLTEDRVLQAIEFLKNSGDLFSMPKQIQRKCVAFFMHSSEKLNYHGEVAQADADKLLNAWKTESDINNEILLEDSDL